jgi:hypothetical protein
MSPTILRILLASALDERRRQPTPTPVGAD